MPGYHRKVPSGHICTCPRTRLHSYLPARPLVALGANSSLGYFESQASNGFFEDEDDDEYEDDYKKNRKGEHAFAFLTDIRS
jgi:hypothetical protein